MWKRTLIAILPLTLLLVLPLLLRPAPVVRAAASTPRERLVILSPHADSIRGEFERAFQQHYFELTGQIIDIDWRSPGGTADIVRYINDRYEAAFRQYWLALDTQNVWTPSIAQAFRDAKLKFDVPQPTPEMRARAAFLNSDVSIGVDLFFGGGTYDHANQARKGYAVDGGVARRNPEWFKPEIIPERWGGETIYDARGGGYYGVCLSTFGICYNPDRVKELSDPAVPRRWRDLADRRFFGQLCVADPTKSGSINKCFEVLIQQCMAEAVAKQGEKTGVAAGWRDGMNLIKRLVGNSRAVTESAGKVTRDVASGNAAAGMAIDFYALSEAQYADFQTDGRAQRIVYVAPTLGSSVSADPVQLLRGAPNLRAAQVFLDFLLSEPGQQLWEYRAGTPGGPTRHTLRRPPVRRDLYSAKHRQFMADADYNPYRETDGFVYRGAWTGPYFNLIRVLIRTVALDAKDELQAAWRAILDAGGPEAVPEAVAEFDRLPFDYSEAATMGARLYPGRDWPMEAVIALRRDWTMAAIAQYRRAAALARSGR